MSVEGHVRDWTCRFPQIETCSCGTVLDSETRYMYHRFGKSSKEREIEALERIADALDRYGLSDIKRGQVKAS